MKKYINDYIKEIESKDKMNKEEIEELLIKIKFFSHERLIHLLVTMFFALFTILFLYFSINSSNFLFMIITFILLIVLGFYIFHYFFLENSVQYLYKLYDKMNKKIK